MSPRDGWWVSDVWGALDGRTPPGLRVVPTSHSLDLSGDFERGLLDCGVKVSFLGGNFIGARVGEPPGRLSL